MTRETPLAMKSGSISLIIEHLEPAVAASYPLVVLAYGTRRDDGALRADVP